MCVRVCGDRESGVGCGVFAIVDYTGSLGSNLHVHDLASGIVKLQLNHTFLSNIVLAMGEQF